VTFRTRLLATSLLTLVVGLGALVVAGNVLLAAQIHSTRSSLLAERAQALLASLEVRSGQIVTRDAPNDNVLDRQSWVLDGGRVLERPAGAAAGLDATAVQLGRTASAGDHEGPDDTVLRVQPVLDDGGRPVGAVVVALSEDSLERVQKAVLLGSLVVAALVVLAGGLAVRGAVDGALRPVGQMTDAATEWGSHDLDRRFDLGPPRDELTRLAATLDSLLGRIAASRRHEQRFASEVAHELRTPLAGIRARAELALAQDDASEQTEALRAVIAHAERLDAAITALLAVARQELDPTQGASNLTAIAREFDGVDVVAPPDLPAVEGEQEVVRRALAPLVDNARRHAKQRTVIELSADAGHVRAAVCDDGPGPDPALGDRVFEPGVRGNHEGGAGLGLALARRLAQSCGGDVVIGDGPGGCFVLELPAIGPARSESVAPGVAR
jgi:signal transduction histidine kinase